MSEVRLVSNDLEFEVSKSTQNKNISNEVSDASIAAKKLTSDHDLDIYFKARPGVSFCNHAVAVVAAVAAVVTAVSSVIAASTRGRTLDSRNTINLEDEMKGDLDVCKLVEVRRSALEK